ncbi:MAG: hypothetical protein WCC81_08740 [Pseudolabrys sp.]
MSQDETLPVSIIALRAERYLPDGNVVISLRTKVSSAERKYSVPLECFHDLIIDLQRLNASKAVEPSIQSEETPMAAEGVPTLIESANADDRVAADKETNTTEARLCSVDWQ